MKHASEAAARNQEFDCRGRSSLTTFLTRESHTIHLIGVAGSGMSGIAGLLLQLGHNVSGSDKATTSETERLQRLGLRFFAQHRAEDTRDAELIVFSSAIKIDNPILANACNVGKPMARRAEAAGRVVYPLRRKQAGRPEGRP